MKTVTCESCGNMRSGRIKTCSACEDGALRSRRTGVRLVAVAFVGVAAVWSQIATDLPLLGARSADATTGPTVWSTAASSGTALACEEELACWGNLHHDAAVRACSAEMTRQRGDRLQLVPGYAAQNFGEYAWHPSAPLAIAYSGDGGRIAAADGGLRLVSYTCDYDPVAHEVIGLRID